MIATKSNTLTQAADSYRSRTPTITGVSLHLVGTYLPVTENWMYRRLCGLKRYTPVVLAGELRDAGEYPLEQVHVLGYYKRLRYRILDRLTAGKFVFHNANYHALRDVSPKIVHSHFAPEAVRRRELRTLARKRFSCPTVCSFYGYDLRGLIPGQKWAGFEQLLGEETAFIVQGPRMAEHMVELGCDPSKIYINPLGIDLSLFPERSTRYDGHSLRVLTVGRLVEKKGIADAVRAVALARRKGIAVSLTVVGDGELRRSIEGLIKAEAADGFVQLLGTVNYSTLNQVYYSHDVCLAPSVTAANGDTEGGVNLCIIEAMAAGLPIIATRHADTATTVAEGENAFLADEFRFDQLAEAIFELARNVDLWHSFSVKGRSRACLLFDAQKQALELESIYDQIRTRM
jgi:colanic acid/amylovoran biosynthesis glycosyltransferase